MTISIHSLAVAHQLVTLSAMLGRSTDEAFERCRQVAEELREPYRSKLLSEIQQVWEDLNRTP